MALNFMMPEGDKDPLQKHLYRSDKVTAASFVSHRADLKERQLARIDLLPRIKGKTMISKELAPLFAGKEHELLERFAMLAAVLDGQGFKGDSGAQGRRGYDTRINFQWLGATTPLSPEVLEVMAQLGPRLLFYNADRPRKTIDQLADFAGRPGESKRFADCRAAVREFLLTLHRLRPAGSVTSEVIGFSKLRLRQLALWADILARLRANNRDAVEHAERVLGMLKNVAMGSALAHGRDAVADYDLAQVAHIALSSGENRRGRVLRAVLEAGGAANSTQLASATRLRA